MTTQQELRPATHQELTPTRLDRVVGIANRAMREGNEPTRVVLRVLLPCATQQANGGATDATHRHRTIRALTLWGGTRHAPCDHLVLTIHKRLQRVPPWCQSDAQRRPTRTGRACVRIAPPNV